APGLATYPATGLVEPLDRVGRGRVATLDNEVDRTRESDLLANLFRLGERRVLSRHQLGRIGFDLDRRQGRPSGKAHDDDGYGGGRSERGDRGDAASGGGPHTVGVQDRGDRPGQQEQ